MTCLVQLIIKLNYEFYLRKLFFYVEQVMNGMSRKLVRCYIKIEHPLQNEKKKDFSYLNKLTVVMSHLVFAHIPAPLWCCLSFRGGVPNISVQVMELKSGSTEITTRFFGATLEGVHAGSVLLFP